jgi:hypothetical protein
MPRHFVEREVKEEESHQEQRPTPENAAVMRNNYRQDGG